MNRPWVIWSVSGIIALLVFGAMAVITRHTLGLEKENAQSEAKAELEGRIRIALWRMDSYAAGILAEENNRPAWHFREVNKERASRLSPLNVDIPANVNLHFQYSNSQLSSPQVNGWGNGKNAWDVRLAPVQQGVKLSARKENDLRKLNGLLLEDGTYAGWQTKRNVQMTLPDNNLGVVSLVAAQGAADEKSTHFSDTQTRDSVAIAKEQRLENPQSQVRNLKDYQVNYNSAEKVKRKEIVQKSIDNRSIANKKWNRSRSRSKEESKDQAKPLAAAKSEQAKDQLNPEPQTQDAKLDLEIYKSIEEKNEEVIEGAYQAPLKPVWIGRELILVREVQDAKGKRVQGVWLDARSIEKELLQNIVDLLPEAKLEPVKLGVRALLGEERDPSSDDPMVLAALPWKLIPGEVAVASPVGWTPMRKTLAVAWVGALLAAFAAMIVLRGVVKLSERRAAFVSSVTHELRTPLTTFSLYSDMLAEGMVNDQQKRQNYLETLRKESSRLTHLVENVLAYSRIERGSARARVEKVEVGSLIDRMCERLRKRAEEDGMELCCDVPDELSRVTLDVDTTAVEQIVFNLVDNASKYASGDGCGSLITLSALERGRYLVFQVCDQGRGIPAKERKRLFRAFHKSAQEAAHSKPGVGLGLALCRRLARALGGDLRIAKSEEGSCFELLLRH